MHFDLTFLGTGVSHSIPKLDHALDPAVCAVCADAALGGVLSKNRRNNISACLRFYSSLFTQSSHGEMKRPPDAAAIIDVGKTFRDSILSWFGSLNVTHLDSILISHKHADAIGGLDDLRDMQGMEAYVDSVSGLSTFAPGRPLNLIADADCLWGINGISTRFAYLNPPDVDTCAHPCHVPARAQCPTCVNSQLDDPRCKSGTMFKPVARLTWWCTEFFEPFFLHGVSVMVCLVLQIYINLFTHTIFSCTF